MLVGMKTVATLLCIHSVVAQVVWSNFRIATDLPQCHISGCAPITGEVTQDTLLGCLSSAPPECTYNVLYSYTGPSDRVCTGDVIGFSMLDLLPAIGQPVEWVIQDASQPPTVSLIQGVPTSNEHCLYEELSGSDCTAADASSLGVLEFTSQPLAVDARVLNVMDFSKTIVLKYQQGPESCKRPLTRVQFDYLSLTLRVPGFGGAGSDSVSPLTTQMPLGFLIFLSSLLFSVE
eukprot:Gregarina_sp_Pseudo_9__1169@NODE_176_length_3816_cov_36_555732_g162_i0_p2_GENE_NODE_176_length_3816_cov_36_555732_g162_i0NODE_176_length_3816_cov_36_555732_g162_i0_p2_ORF_typecomplete_len233_score24_87_NODE_176_length_3816_cov_36_555732_g162_i029963694